MAFAQENTVQCEAKTKSGKQCKRQTTGIFCATHTTEEVNDKAPVTAPEPSTPMEMFMAMEKMELVRLANLMYDLNVNKDYRQSDIAAMVISAQIKFKGNQDIQILSDNDTEVEVKPGYCKIRIQPGTHNLKMRPAIVGHQFVLASLPVNKDIIIPSKYVDASLALAEMEVYFTDPETKEWVATKELVYPFSIIERG